MLIRCCCEAARLYVYHSMSTKRKGSNKEKATKGDAKRSRGSLERDWTENINSANITDCTAIQSSLENLLEKAKERIASLKGKKKDRGLSYKGKNKVKCGCGHTFKSKGGFGKTCEQCPKEKRKEKCIECTEECKGDNCGGMIICGDCKSPCDACEESFCEECLGECRSCTYQFCGRSDSCELLNFGYGGDPDLCKGCIEERR